MRAKHPDIEVICLISQDVANLTRRDADIAVRTVRPDAPDLIVRRLATLKTGIYAARAYLLARGTPALGSGFTGHDLVAYQQPVTPILTSSFCGEPTGSGKVVFRTSSSVTLVEATAAGIGVAELPCYRADTEPELVRIMPGRSSDFDVWLVAHADLHKTARIQAVIGELINEFDSTAR